MLEFVLWVIAAGCVVLLARPLRRRLPLPEWLVRARKRRRPGIPVTAWIAALLLMELAWLFGERRGLAALLPLSIWIVAPLLATWVSWYWIKGLKEKPAINNRDPEASTVDSRHRTQDSVEPAGEHHSPSVPLSTKHQAP